MFRLRIQLRYSRPEFVREVLRRENAAKRRRFRVEDFDQHFLFILIVVEACMCAARLQALARAQQVSRRPAGGRLGEDFRLLRDWPQPSSEQQ